MGWVGLFCRLVSWVGLGWVGSISYWVELGWITENGPTSMSGIFGSVVTSSENHLLSIGPYLIEEVYSPLRQKTYKNTIEKNTENTKIIK